MQTAEAVEEILLKVKKEGEFSLDFASNQESGKIWVQPAQVGFRDATSRSRVKLVK